jgi:hypothetical protein
MACKEAATRRVSVRAFYAIMYEPGGHARVIVSKNIKAFQKFVCVNLGGVLWWQRNDKKCVWINGVIGNRK